MNRKLLNASIRAVLVSTQMSQSDLAMRLRVTPATLRTWLNRNCFPEFAIKRILNELGWKHENIEQLGRDYEFKVARPASGGRLNEQNPLRAAFVAADRERNKIAVSMAPMTDAIETFCAAMGKSDLMITLAATVTPWEMEQTIGQPMRDAILQGVRGGGTFLYLRANQTQVEKYRNDWQFDRLRDTEDCDREIVKLRQFLSGRLQEEDGMLVPDADELAYRATPQYLVRGDIPFFVPGFHMIMLRSAIYPGGEEDRMIVRLPDNSWSTVYLTRADYFRDRFRRSVCTCLGEERNQLNQQIDKLSAEQEELSSRSKRLTEQHKQLQVELQKGKEILDRLMKMLGS